MTTLAEALTTEREKRRREAEDSATRREVGRAVLQALAQRLNAEPLPTWFFISKGDEILVAHTKNGAASRQHVGTWVVDQQMRLARAAGVDPAAVARAAELTGRAADLATTGRTDPAARGELTRLYLELERLLPAPPAPDLASPQARAERQVTVLLSPAFRSDLLYDPRPVLARSRQPVLVLGGGRDLQTAPEVNFPPLRAALAGPGRDVEMVVWPGLNHLLQPARTGLPDEYGRIDTTLDERVPRKIAAWVGARFGPRARWAP